MPTLKALKVRDTIFVLRSTQHKFRVVKLINEGKGYSNILGSEEGLTNIRQLEFIDTPNMNLTELHQWLSQYATEAQVVEVEY